MNSYELEKELKPLLQTGQLTKCLERVASVLSALPLTPFHKVLEVDFENKPIDIATYFADFISKAKQEINLKALYTETNGFDINTDCWFFDIFGFEYYGGHEDYDWLSDYETVSQPSMTLIGMETLQAVYEQYYSDKEIKDTRDIVSLLVVIKFQILIKKAVPLINGLDIPILATSHDYEFIYEYKPNAIQ